jgi:hypothetical protein
MILLILPISYAVGLEAFPAMFLDEARVIVGRSAAAEDVVGAIDIMTSLQQKAGSSKITGGAVLDIEVTDIEDMNSIVVGGPCINSAAAYLLNYPVNCLEGFDAGKGIIRVYEFNNGKFALLAAGTTALDTRRVTNVLANYNDYSLSGMEMVIAGLNMNRIDVNIK